MRYDNTRVYVEKVDIKDGILIIASERERVKMNVYEWLESPDVREYLENIHYEFTLPEAFYVIRENEQRALEEKFAAWEELLDVMPDCPFSIESDNIAEWKEALGAVPGWSFSIESDGGGKVETASFHMAVREFIGYQKGLLEEAFRKDGAGAYGAWDVKDGKKVSLSEYLANWQDLDRTLDYNRVETWPLGTEWKENQNGLRIWVNRKKQVTEIRVEKRGKLGYKEYESHPLQEYQLPLPTPFCRGDIVDNGHGYPMVLDSIAGWSKEKLLGNGLFPQREDEKKSIGYELFDPRDDYDDILNLINCSEISVAPIRMQYYRKPLKGSKQVLRAVSSYLKGNLELGQMCMAYHIFAKEWEARSLRTQLIASYEFDNRDIDTACAAGLELNEGPEGEMDE